MTTRSFMSNRPRGFTIIELLVVISIIIIAVVAILPAFGRLIESQNYAASVNSVTATLGSARARAVERGRRVGVAFLWDAKEERYSLMVVEQLQGQESGSLTNQPTGRGLGAYADVFFPVKGAAPVELPKGVGVFGLSSLLPVGSAATTPITDIPVDCWEWYAGEVINGDNDSETRDDIYLWIFPRNDPRLFTQDENSERRMGVDPWERLRGISTIPPIDPDEALEAVRNATTFFVLFSPDGSVTTSRRTGVNEYFDAFLEYPDRPVRALAPNSPPYDDPLRFDPEDFAGVPEQERTANPEFMLRSVDQLAVVDLGRLADGVGIPRAWLIRPRGSNAFQPAYLVSLGYFDDEKAKAVSRWIDLNGEIINFNRYSGNVIRRRPS
jgi:type II secretory pathway pseudopilin PulG